MQYINLYSDWTIHATADMVLVNQKSQEKSYKKSM